MVVAVKEEGGGENVEKNEILVIAEKGKVEEEGREEKVIRETREEAARERIIIMAAIEIRMK